MQAFGSWIKIPVIPILIQTVFFASMHPYNLTGVIAVAIMGIALGFCAVITKGLESGCALHIANNMTAFYLTGFGIGKISSEVNVWSVVMVSALCLIYVGIMLFADKKLGWFSHVKHPEKMPAA